MSDKQQTAVQWLMEQIKSDSCQTAEDVVMLLNQARLREWKMILQIYSDGLGNGQAYANGEASSDVLDEKKYYHKTYGGDNEQGS